MISTAKSTPTARPEAKHTDTLIPRVRRLSVVSRGLQEEGEDILVHAVSRTEALAMLGEDRIPNGHTLIALQWLQIHGEALRERWC